MLFTKYISLFEVSSQQNQKQTPDFGSNPKMKIFVVTLLAALAYGSPYNGDHHSFESDSVENHHSDENSGSYESLALASASGWRKEALDYVNELRAQASLEPLEYSESLSSSSQKWAENIACGDAYHSKLGNGVNAENLAGLYTNKGEVEMAKDGIKRWYDEVYGYDCRPVTDHKSKYYLSVGHYMNLMRSDFHQIGFGMKVCDGDKSKGQLVAQFHYDDKKNWPLWNAQLEKQGLPKYNTAGLDTAAFTPCPHFESQK